MFRQNFFGGKEDATALPVVRQRPSDSQLQWDSDYHAAVTGGINSTRCASGPCRLSSNLTAVLGHRCSLYLHFSEEVTDLNYLPKATWKQMAEAGFKSR